MKKLIFIIAVCLPLTLGQGCPDVINIYPPAQDLIVVDLPDWTELSFENYTGWDLYITYYADGVWQDAYVYDGESLLLEYPCLDLIELVSEDDIDPITGVLVDSFDLTGEGFLNPDDFICGDTFILTFDAFSINARAEVGYLSP
jgi:hypothetical protein